MHYVGVGRRFWAILIDSLIALAWTYPLAQLADFHYVRDPLYFHVQAGWYILSFAITVAYFTLFESLFGATIGKFATGIRVRKADGSRLDFAPALIRNLLRIIDAIFVYLVGAIFVWTSPIKQRLGDRVAKTVVVTASSVGTASGVAYPPGNQSWMPPVSTAPGGLTPPPMPPPPLVPGVMTPTPDPIPPAEPVPQPEPPPSRDPDPPSSLGF
jgi:uncharacterized RDD family membrane protein YckC